MKKDVQIAINIIERTLKNALELRHYLQQEIFDGRDEAIDSLNDDIKAMERTLFILTSL